MSHVPNSLSSYASTFEISMTESVCIVGERNSALISHSFCFFPFAQARPFKESSHFSFSVEMVCSAFSFCAHASLLD